MKAFVGWGLLVALAAGAWTGCIKAPPVVLLDRQTALEEQAAGDYPVLERDLRQAALRPRAEALTSGELAAAGEAPGGDMDSLLAIYGAVRSDTGLVDDLLVARCLGESLEGLLVETPESCTHTGSRAQVARVMQRANRNRAQLWIYMAKRSPEAQREGLLQAWREQHLRDLICGGQVQAPGGEWQIKECE